MIGIKYVLFVKEVSQKEIANQLHVTSQLVASWCNESRKISEFYLIELEKFLDVPGRLLKKQLSLKDKVEIELLLQFRGSSEIELDDFDILNRHSKLNDRYRILLNDYMTVSKENKELKKKLERVRELVSFD